MTPEDLPPPAAALIASARHVLPPPSTDRSAGPPVARAAPCDVDAAVATAISPETRTQYALRHGMVAWPPAPFTDGALRTHMTRALQGVRLLQQLTRLFADAAIDVVTLKGPAFSQWLYGDPCARRFGDLDLLVSSAQLAAAVRLLQELGYAPQVAGRSGEVVFSNLGAVPMVRGDDHQIDLHWRLAARRFSTVLDAAAVLRQAIPMPFAGGVVRVPRPEHTATLALAHAAKHLWYALELPLSIAMLVRRTDIDWNEVHALVVEGGAVRAAATGLVVAADLFGADVPSAFRADIHTPDVQELRRCARLTLTLPPGIFPDRRLEWHIQRLSFDRAADRVRYDVRRIVEPTRADVDWVHLPDAMTPLYWPVRLLRLGATVLGLSATDRSSD